MNKKVLSIISFLLAAIMMVSVFGISVSAVDLKRPVMESIKANATSVTFKWSDTNEYLTGYALYRKPATSTGKWSRIKTVTNVASTSYTDKTVSPGNEYYYTIKTYYTSGGKTVYSKSCGDYKVKTIPSKPSFSLVGNYGTGVYMKWNAFSDASGLVIYRSLKGTKGTWTRIQTIKSNKAGYYVDPNVKIGTKYYYLLKTYKTVSGKNYYSDISVVYPKKISDVSAPENLKVESTLSGIKVTYDRVLGTQGYRIYRKNLEDGTDWVKKTLYSDKITEYLDETAKEGVRYVYTVKSFKTVSGKTYFSKSADYFYFEAESGERLAETRFKNILESDKFTFAFEKKEDLNDTDLTVSFSFSKSGKKLACDFSAIGVSGRFINNGEKCYILVPSLKKYFETKESVSVDEIYREVGNLDGVFVSKDDNAEYGGAKYICEEYNNNGTITRFYFSKTDKTLKFIEVINSFTSIPEVVTVKKLEKTVDESVFTIPKDYTELSSTILDTLMKSYDFADIFNSFI